MSIRAFTIIELLIVITIIGLLASMAFPLINLARRESEGTDTSSLLAKIHGALEMFRRDVGAYPYYKYEDSDMPNGGDSDRLAERLASVMKDADLAKLRADIEAVHAAYSGSGAHRIDYQVLPDSGHSSLPEPWRTMWERNKDPNDEKKPDSFKDNRPVYAALLNRLATERAVAAVMSGHVQVKGIVLPGTSYDKSSQQVIAPQSSGWRDDYLGNAIDRRRSISGKGTGKRFVDAFGKPLIYINPVVPGVSGGYPNSGMWVSDKPVPFPIDIDIMYAKALPDDRSKSGLWPQGREPGSGADDDCREKAPRARRFLYDLWSAGPDGEANYKYNDETNKDNIPKNWYWESNK
ncbi:MAG: prepilin-type N-terminal cleavage/methylation domain-containing protein [Rectinema sp.]|nr:prepilin-type N-terminal cleavage/methylation domain-containing protein [Rectinema sp.]